MPYKVVIFTGQFSQPVRVAIVKIDRAIADITWLVVIHSPRRTATTLVRNQWKNLRRNGWRWLPYQAGDLLRRAAARQEASVHSVAREYTPQALAALGNVRILHVDDIHADTTLAEIHAFDPDLGLSLASPILRAPLFSIPKRGTLNLHKGKLPQYRGMPPAFWELWNDEERVGCTVHQVDAKLDTGAVVVETSIPREKFSTVRGLQLSLDEAGNNLLHTAVARALSDECVAAPQIAGGVTFRKPTLAQISRLERRLALVAPRNDRSPRHFMKETAYGAAIALSRIGLRSAMRPRLTVLLYHRISDDTRDNLTVGIEQFDRQMALLRRHCEVLSLEEVLSMGTIPVSRRPLVSVTFDDGYLDNFTNAFPILVRNAVPAAFFISTGIIGTDRPFPHDIRRGAARPPVMTWDHVREMHAQGFSFGSHSASHIDCVTEPESVVVEELAQSKADLQAQLGLDEICFAYPYGGRQHMNAQRMNLVRQAGYTGCLSAYGGFNIGSLDRFNVLRGGIHWGFSDRAFMVRCLGLR